MDDGRIIICMSSKFVGHARGASYMRVLKILGSLLPQKIGRYCNNIITGDVTKIRGKLILVNGTDLEDLVHHFSRKLFDDILFHNKVLWIQDIDRDYDLVNDPVLESARQHPNFYRITDCPDQANDQTFFCENFFMGANDLSNVGLLASRSLSNQYLCLMKKQRPHRDKLTQALGSKFLISGNHVSYHGNPDIVQGLIKRTPFDDLEGFNEITHDWPDIKINPYYLTCSLELIVETLPDRVFVTEKTIRPLTAGLPFLIISGKGHLSHLRDKGFLTCNSLWDESYDSIDDLDQRIDAVTDILSHLNKGNDRYLTAFTAFQPNVEHNRKLLLHYEQEIDNMVRDQLINILEVLT